MFKNTDIKQVLKIMLLVLSVVFMLSACERGSSETGARANSRAALPSEYSNDTASISQKHRECWQTGMISLLYDNMGKVAMGMYAKITDGALPLMMVAFAVWTAFRLLRFVGSFTEDSPAEIWNEIVRKLFVCFICGYLASSTASLLWILDKLIFPIYYAFLELGSAILSTTGDGKGSEVSKGVISFFQEQIEVGKPVLCKAPGMGSASLTAFPSGPKEMMECMICAVNERLSLGFYLSFNIMAAPGFMALITGFLILACFTFVKLGFVFYLVDSIFRFTMMATILPILIMSYAFKQTSSWAKHGFLTIINSAALMMFMAVMMAMALLAMEKIISDNANIFSGAGVEKEAYKRTFSEFSVPFMCIMMIAFLIVSSISIAQQVTDSLVGGNSNSAFQKRAGKLTAQIFWGILGIITFGGSRKIRDAFKAFRGKK